MEYGITTVTDQKILNLKQDIKARCTKTGLAALEDGEGLCTVLQGSSEEPEMVMLPYELYQAIRCCLDYDPAVIDPTLVMEREHDLSNKQLASLAAFMKLELGVCVEDIIDKLQKAKVYE